MKKIILAICIICTVFVLTISASAAFPSMIYSPDVDGELIIYPNIYYMSGEHVINMSTPLDIMVIHKRCLVQKLEVLSSSGGNIEEEYYFVDPFLYYTFLKDNITGEITVESIRVLADELTEGFLYDYPDIALAIYNDAAEIVMENIPSDINEFNIQLKNAYEVYKEYYYDSPIYTSEDFRQYLYNNHFELYTAYITGVYQVSQDLESYVTERKWEEGYQSGYSQGNKDAGNITDNPQYDYSHSSHFCPDAGSGPATCYDIGFRDGYEAGCCETIDNLANTEYFTSVSKTEFEKYVSSEEFTSSSTYTEIQNSYKQTNEYITEMESAYSEGSSNAVTEYKQSEEYNNTLNERYDTGSSVGYDIGYAEAAELSYNKGVLAGIAQYQSSSDYQSALQNYYSTGYREGYNDGADSVPQGDVGSVITLFILAFGGVILVMILYRKKKRGYRR